MKPSLFILDVDGVLGSGQFLYGPEGKSFKIFGADDADALKWLEKFIAIEFVSADHRGFEITQKRVQDMGFKVTLVSQAERLVWLKNRRPLDEIIYMGDGFWDGVLFKEVSYSIAPSDAFFRTKEAARFITQHAAANRAVAEAALHIGQTFFNETPYLDR